MPPSTRPRPVVELRDPLHGPIPVTKGELDVIDTPVFQRLRGIKQLGFAEYVFPGAVHHRYLHSIGAMHVGGLLMDRIIAGEPRLQGAEGSRLRQLVRLAALLHDVGHPPLSHAAEALLPPLAELQTGHGKPGRASHEDMTFELVTASPLTKTLNRAFGDQGISAADVAAVIASEPGDRADAFVVDGIDHWPLVHAMVSGEMDVDRMDYLLRDSHYAGVRYGVYDRDWLLSHTRVVDDGATARLALDLRALPAFEHFLLARYHMFQMVYFHPKSDIYDAMLRRWLDATGNAARFPAAPDAYVACDDAWLRQRLLASDDPFAKRIVEQRPHMLLTELRLASDHDQRERVDAVLAGLGVEPLWLTSRPVLSRYAQSAAELRTNPLLVYDRRPPTGGSRLLRIEEVTDLFDRYDRTLQIARVYVAPEHLRAAREALKNAG